MDKQFCIFDMDGTLVDSMGYWKRLGREFLAQKGVTENVEPVLERIKPMTMTESAALFIAGAYRRVRVGSLFLVVANQERAKKGLPNAQVHDTDLAIRVAIDAIRKMIDKEGH